jgi:hypothetical protein
MQDLVPVGLSKDGLHLILISAAGEEFAVPFDRRLRVALRGDDPRLGQLEMKMESALRPRDIQTRIRSGESPEDVALAAQTTIEKIMVFAGPVLAERAHVALSAQNSSVRRKSAETSSAARTLGEAAGLVFRDLNLHSEDVEWDAWRREDGRWTLTADYAAGGRPRHAVFTYDMPGRYVVADNDEARTLTGELHRKEAGEPREGTGGSAGTARRLSAVPNQDELPLGDDAIEMVSGPHEDTVDLSATVNAIRATDDRADDELTADTADADWIASPVDGAAPVDEPTMEEPVDTTDDGHPAPPKKKGRASVPTWDEIMFGGGKAE